MHFSQFSHAKTEDSFSSSHKSGPICTKAYAHDKDFRVYTSKWLSSGSICELHPSANKLGTYWTVRPQVVAIPELVHFYRKASAEATDERCAIFDWYSVQWPLFRLPTCWASLGFNFPQVKSINPVKVSPGFYRLEQRFIVSRKAVQGKL